jgi:hypothetical protein
VLRLRASVRALLTEAGRKTARDRLNSQTKRKPPTTT